MFGKIVDKPQKLSRLNKFNVTWIRALWLDNINIKSKILAIKVADYLVEEK